VNTIHSEYLDHNRIEFVVVCIILLFCNVQYIDITVSFSVVDLIILHIIFVQ